MSSRIADLLCFFIDSCLVPSYRYAAVNMDAANHHTSPPKSFDEVVQSLEAAHNEISKLKNYLEDKFEFESNLERRIASLEAENKEIRNYASDLEEYVLNLDSATRKRNLVISGLGETKGETPSTLLIRIYKFLMTYVDTLELSDIDCVYRLGKQGGRNRPILCKFVKEKVRNAVASIKMNLNDEDADKKIYLNDDLPQLIKDRRADFRTIVKLAKSQNIPASMTNSKITVNNVTYSHKNLDCLPTGLKLEDARMINVQGGIAFFSSHAWLSNFYPAPIVIQGHSFRTSEHAYQYAKAIRLGDPHTGSLILRAKKPSEAKLLGSGVKRNDKWDDDKIDVMRHVISEKFKQHKELRDKLLATGQENLIEASLDSFWGAKATLTSKSIKNNTWTGANTLGKIIAEVRLEIKREVDAFNMCLPNAPTKQSLQNAPLPQPTYVATQQTQQTDVVHSTPALNNNSNGNSSRRTYPMFGSGRGRGNRRRQHSNDPCIGMTQDQVSRKNKTRPSSSSSAEGTYASAVSNRKKQRTHSPLSALPPPRLAIADIFTTDKSAADTTRECPFEDGEYY